MSKFSKFVYVILVMALGFGVGLTDASAQQAQNKQPKAQKAFNCKGDKGAGCQRDFNSCFAVSMSHGWSNAQAAGFCSRRFRS